MTFYVEDSDFRATCVGCATVFRRRKVSERYCRPCRAERRPQRDAQRRYEQRVKRSRAKGVRTRSPWGTFNAVPPDALLPYPVAQSLGDRSEFWYLRTCPVCRQARPMLNDRKTCSRSCGAILIGVAKSPEHMAKMQDASARLTSERAELRDIGTIVEQQLSTVEAYRIGKRRGYMLGFTRGARAERKWWEEAYGLALVPDRAGTLQSAEHSDNLRETEAP